MANDQLNEALRFRPWPPGDPWVLVDQVLREVEGPQQRLVLGLALESVAATLQVNLKLVQGLQQIVAGGNQRQSK
jgi:hypothetical protein